MLAQLKGLFTANAIAQSLNTLPPMETTIMDGLFKQRPTHPLPLMAFPTLFPWCRRSPWCAATEHPFPLKGKRQTWNLSLPCLSR